MINTSDIKSLAVCVFFFIKVSEIIRYLIDRSHQKIPCGRSAL